ncbi:MULTISPECIES: hypothetical protein [unclassified Streptomyces]|uniref:hypothetical protein n=1 Tax=unclassified Streptomyces TaxID=2593676 RepID=UPI002DDA9C20|nr:hypothetical protein [Streptomyces sp. NBC_01750]WSA98727.1 hypothetical protein OIE54_05365 [Streptomyces sp. NBC_01794]WSD36703.1 hypothetical protein OG966_35205 [Streptomyces sp. NBC_01750]
MSGARVAGWLFADLLLVMVVVALGGETTTKGAGAHIRPELTAGPTGTPAPAVSTPAPGTPAGGLDPHTKSISVRTDPGDLVGGSDAAAASIRRQVVRKAEQFQGERAAFVIVFGNAGRLPGGAVDTRSSTEYAEAVARLLPSAKPDFFPPYDEKIIRSYHNTDPRVPSGTAEIELFFLLH